MVVVLSLVIAPCLSTKSGELYDDDRFGLTREPFVLGADTVVELLGKPFARTADKRFKLIFSAHPLPNAHMVADRFGEWTKDTGAFYRTRADSRELWLCPALFHYYAEAPETIYARAEPA